MLVGIPATSVLLYVGIYKPFFSEFLPPKPELTKSESIWVYGFAKSITEASDIGYPVNSFVAENNRKVIRDWIQHAEDNSYNFIFC